MNDVGWIMSTYNYGNVYMKNSIRSYHVTVRQSVHRTTEQYLYTCTILVVLAKLLRNKSRHW